MPTCVAHMTQSRKHSLLYYYYYYSSYFYYYYYSDDYYYYCNNNSWQLEKFKTKQSTTTATTNTTTTQPHPVTILAQVQAHARGLQHPEGVDAALFWSFALSRKLYSCMFKCCVCFYTPYP